MKDKTDWKRVRAMKDAQIKKSAAADPDSFMPDKQWFAKAHLVMPEPKDMVTLRLDHDVVQWFRGAGRGYQTRINAVLKAFVEAQQPPR